MNELRYLLSTNQSDRLAKEKAAQDRIDDPKLPRHTVYQGDRKIQQLGQDVIENGVIFNNQSVAIGDVMLPLAKGNVLRRVDNTNGGALLGTAYRDALENDFDANGNRNSTGLSRNGGNENPDPFNPNNPNNGNQDYPQFAPPFGCTPPPTQCFWTTNPITPDGFQGYGSAVVNENGVSLYLYCVAGTAVSPDLNCEFLRWKCIVGQCFQMTGGTYASKAACEAARVRLYTVSRSGTGAANCAGEGVIIPEDSIPQDSPWTPPYSSSIKAGTTEPCGNSQWDVFDANGLIFTTSGRYSFYNIIDAGFRCP